VQLISGSQARAMFVSGERPPTWFMRPEVSQIVLAALAKGEVVFED
jgi:ATP sulfurylase